MGFLTVALTEEPSPNDQDHEVGVLVEASVKATVSGAVPEVGVPVKLATGATVAAVTLIYPMRVKVLLPAAFVAVSATV